MSYKIKVNQAAFKDADTSQYLAVDVLAEQTKAGLISEIQQAGEDVKDDISSAGAAEVAAIEQKGVETRESIPDDYSALQDEVDDLKSLVSQSTGNELIEFSDPANGYYIYNNVEAGTAVDVNNPRTATNYAYALLPCAAGDLFVISGKAGDSARLYSFLDESYKLITKANANAEYHGVVITAPQNSAYLLLNSEVHTEESYRGLLVKNELDDLKTDMQLYGNADFGYSYIDSIGEFVVGGLSGATVTSIPYRIVTKEKVTLSQSKLIKIATGRRISIAYFESDDSITDTGWIPAGEYTLRADVPFYMQISSFSATTPDESNVIASVYDFVKYVTVITQLGEVTESAYRNERQLSGIESIVLEQIVLTQAYFETLPYNGYLKLDGSVSGSSDWHTSGYIAFVPAYAISYSVCGHNSVATLMFYDADKNILGYVSAPSGANVPISGSAVAPEGTVYFRYSVRIDSTYSSQDDHITYYVENTDAKLLTGKVWNVLGDSITANPAYASQRYFERISARQGGMTVRNYGIGGTRIGGTDSNAFCNRYASMDDNADIITVYGGVNDYGQSNPTPLGAYGDTTNATFYGALKILIEGLIEKYPYALIVFMTPIQPNYTSWSVGLEENSLGFTIYDYADAIIKMCGRYGVPVVDLCRTCGFTSRIDSEKTKYFYDGLHLNDNGHNKISYLIESAMELNAKGKIIDLVD